MTLIRSFEQKGIIRPAGKTGLYGVEFNGKTGLQEEEVVPDTNKNGRTDLKEVLEFVVNRVPHLPVIHQVQEVIEDECVEEQIVLDEVERVYLPQLRTAALRVEKERREQWQPVIKEYERIDAEIKERRRSLEPEKTEELIAQNTTLAVELAIAGHHVLEQHKIYFLRSGQTILAQQAVRHYTGDYVEELELAGRTNVRLPNGVDAYVSRSIYFDPFWNIEKVFLAQPVTVLLPNGIPVQAVGDLSFHPSGQIKSAQLYDAVTMKLPNGVEAHVEEVTFDENGHISYVKMHPAVAVVLPNGITGDASELRFDAEGRITAADLTTSVAVQLPNGITARSKELNFHPDGTISCARLEAPVFMVLPNGATAEVWTVSFNGAGAIEGWVSCAYTWMKLPNGDEAFVSGIMFDRSGKLRYARVSTFFDAPKKVLLPNGVRTNVNELWFDGTGKITRAGLKKFLFAYDDMVLPNGVEAALSWRVQFNDAGQIEGTVHLSEPVVMTMPNGEEGLVEGEITFNAGKIVGMVQFTRSFFNDYPTMQLPDGSSAKVRVAVFDEDGCLVKYVLVTE